MSRELPSGDQKTPATVPEERNGSLNPVEQALRRAYTNLVDWHDFLVDQNGDILKRGGVLPVGINGRTISYEVSAVRGSRQAIYLLDEAADAVNFNMIDPKQGSHPKGIELYYKNDRIGEATGLLGVKVLWDHKDGLVGELIICPNGRITHILRVGTNNIYYSNPDHEDARVDFGSDRGQYISQGMALQFVYNGTGNLEHHYARLGNWNSTLFFYVDGEPWDHKTPFPKFPYRPNTIYYSGGVSRYGREYERYVSFDIFKDYTFPDLSAYIRKTDDGQRFILKSPIEFPDDHRFLKDYRGPKYKLTLEAPLILDVLPHIQRAFPASIEDITPLLSGPYSRMLRLQIEPPSSLVQQSLVRFTQNITHPGYSWKGVTTEQLRDAHEFLFRDGVLTAILEGVGDPHQVTEIVSTLIPRVIPTGYQAESVRIVIKKLAESGVFRELANVSPVSGLTEQDLKWMLEAILQGQTDIIAHPTQVKIDRLGVAKQNLGRFVNQQVYRWRHR